MRCTDADRDAVLKVVSDAFAEGRLDYEEYHHRSDAALSAKTYGDLDRLVHDLPAPGTAGLPEVTHEVERLNAGVSDQVRKGAWQVPPRLVVTALISNVRLDFREATPTVPETQLAVNPGVGDVILVLDSRWDVDYRRVSSSWGSIKDQRKTVPGRDRRSTTATPTHRIVVTGGVGVGSLRVRNARFFDR